MTEPVGEKGYAGDVTPEQAAAWLASGEAVMVDVRTDAEREWVGYVPSAMPGHCFQASGTAPGT